MRFAELAVFLAPLAAFVLWRWAIARGLDGPPPRQLLVILAVLVLTGAWLVYQGERERLAPGRYIPAHVENGQVVPGRTE